MKKIPALALATLLIGACSAYTVIDAGPYRVSETFSVDPQITWSRYRIGRIETWSIDGYRLHSLRFVDGVESGQNLMDLKEDDMPRFDSGMTATELQELIVDTLSNIGAVNVEGSNLEPIDFGPVSGFRFNLAFLTEEGLEMEGIAAGTIYEAKLYLILYTGARQHYFPNYRDHVLRIIDSVEKNL